MKHVLHPASVKKEHVTRGNDLRLKKFRVKYDLRKYSFSVRTVNI